MRKKEMRGPLLSLVKSMHYFNHVVCSYGPAVLAMGGIIKVIASFFFSEKAKKSQSNSTVAGFRATKINRQRYSNLKKHLTEFWGLKEQALQFEIGGFSLKLFRLTKSSTGKCESFALSNRWAVVTRTAKLNI